MYIPLALVLLQRLDFAFLRFPGDIAPVVSPLASNSS